MVLTFLKMLCITINNLYKIMEKKNISHTNAHPLVFTHAFCHTYVENLLKKPAIFHQF